MKKFLYTLFLALAALPANAQDDFNPTLPGEPNALYKVTVGLSHSAAGTVYGDGSYATGNQITIGRYDTGFSSNSTVYYKFKCWTLNGIEYTPAGTASSFTYTIGTDNAVFEAVYEEEDPDEVSSRIYLQADPSDACSFNFESGRRFLEGNSVYIYYNDVSSSFIFEGWYEGDQLITTDRFFYYNVGENDATITARFTYEPAIPGEPNGNQENVDNIIVGDVNGDKKIDIVDIVLLIAYLNGESPSGFVLPAANVDNTGAIDLNDLKALVELVLKESTLP